MADAQSIGLFRERLTRASAVEDLFARFDATRGIVGYLAAGGQSVDATAMRCAGRG